VAVVAVGVGLAVNPTWPAEGVLAALLALGLGLARIPWGARPRVPAWVVVAWVGVGAVLALLAGGKPVVQVGNVAVGLGGLDLWARFVCLATLALLSVALLAWTTPTAELAPALARLGRPLTRGPLHRLRQPVEEVAVVLALAVRCFGLLAQELRVLVAARRVRRRDRVRGGWQAFDEGVDLLLATLVVSIRRAGEMAEAIEARGGFPARLPEGAAPGRADALALGLVGVAVAAMILV
jgi:energy-coupling factor transport system permease protein